MAQIVNGNFAGTGSLIPTAPPTPTATSGTESLKDMSIRLAQAQNSPTNTNTPAPPPTTPPTTTPTTTPSTTPPADNGIQTARQNNGTYTGIDGKSYYNFDHTQVGATPTISTSTGGATDTAGQLAQAQADYQTQAKQVQDTISNIQNGTTPLTPGEQALVSGLQQQFQQMIDAQNKVNTQAEGVANIRGYQTGAAEYDPSFQVKTIGSIVSAGAAKVADLQIKEAQAVAQLTQSFKDKDIAAVKDAWSIYQTASKERTDALQKVITDTQTAIKDAQDQQMKVQQYNLDVAKFNQTGDQQSFDRAFKLEQEKFDETYKNKQLALDQFKAGAGGGGGGVGVSQSAQMSSSGGPDPASQKAVYDQIAQKYGPMTAVAIKGLADYSRNPQDWSSRAAKGMTREQAVTLAQMYDPTYDEKLYSVRSAYQKSIASTQAGTVGSAINSANKAINHLTTYLTTMGNIHQGVSSTVNWAAENTILRLDPNMTNLVSQAGTSGLGVAEELAKFFKGTGATSLDEINAWKEQISPYLSPAMQHGVAQSAIDLLHGQLETLAEQYKQTMGKAPTEDFLGPSARASLSSLKNQGFNVDIPGIPYTDKDAYIKYDSEAQTNMAKAYQTLVDKNDPNNPPTPENVLELAQLQ